MGVAARENMSVGWAGRKIVRLECAYIMKGGRVFFESGEASRGVGSSACVMVG